MEYDKDLLGRDFSNEQLDALAEHLATINSRIRVHVNAHQKGRDREKTLQQLVELGNATIDVVDNRHNYAEDIIDVGEQMKETETEPLGSVGEYIENLEPEEIEKNIEEQELDEYTGEKDLYDHKEDKLFYQVDQYFSAIQELDEVDELDVETPEIPNRSFGFETL